MFESGRAGLGRHEVTYTIQGGLACRNGTARRVALIQEVPQVKLPAEIRLPRGGSTELRPVVTGQPIAYQWSPLIYLTSTTQPLTVAGGVRDSVTYRLEVTTQAGCRGLGQCTSSGLRPALGTRCLQSQRRWHQRPLGNTKLSATPRIHGDGLQPLGRSRLSGHGSRIVLGRPSRRATSTERSIRLLNPDARAHLPGKFAGDVLIGVERFV